MYKLDLENGNCLTVKQLSKAAFEVNEEIVKSDIVQTTPTAYHLLLNNKGYLVEIVEQNNKEFTLKVNGKQFTANLHTPMDLLLEEMGFDTSASQQLSELKAPMPGLVLSVNVEAGQKVAAGDTLLILEAMKMENVLKAPGDALIEKVEVEQGQSVEKNTVLIRFGAAE